MPSSRDFILPLSIFFHPHKLLSAAPSISDLKPDQFYEMERANEYKRNVTYSLLVLQQSRWATSISSEGFAAANVYERSAVEHDFESPVDNVRLVNGKLQLVRPRYLALNSRSVLISRLDHLAPSEDSHLTSRDLVKATLCPQSRCLLGRQSFMTKAVCRSNLGRHHLIPLTTRRHQRISTAVALATKQAVTPYRP